MAEHFVVRGTRKWQTVLHTGAPGWSYAPVHGCLTVSGSTHRVSMAPPLLRPFLGSFWVRVQRDLAKRHGWSWEPLEDPDGYALCYLCKAEGGLSTSCHCRAQRFIAEDERRARRVRARRAMGLVRPARR